MRTTLIFAFAVTVLVIPAALGQNGYRVTTNSVEPIGIGLRDANNGRIPNDGVNVLPPTEVVVKDSTTFNIWSLDVVNGTGVGFDDPIFGAERIARLREVLSYLAAVLRTGGTLDIVVLQSETDGTGLLASAGTCFREGTPGYFNGAAFERLELGNGKILGPFVEEIFVTVDFGFTWNSGSSEPQIDEQDLFTVLLHEICHGLGLASAADTAGVSRIEPGQYTKWDENLVEVGNLFLFGLSPPELVVPPSVLTGDAVYWGGAQAALAYDQGGQKPRIHAPSPFKSGNSLSHWSLGNMVGGAVLEPELLPNHVKRTLRPVEIGALRDIGWTNACIPGGLMPEGQNLSADTDHAVSSDLGDVDSDGDLDLVVGTDFYGPNKLYLNDGTGVLGDGLGGTTGISIGSDVYRTFTVVLADMDSDGDLDMVTASENYRNRLYLNDGNGVFGDGLGGNVGKDITTDQHRTFSVVVGDIDGDGHLDVIAGNSSGSRNRLYINNGTADPFFGVVGQDVTTYAGWTESMALGDIDRDGDLDLISGNAFNGHNRIYLNDGGGVLSDGMGGADGLDLNASAFWTQSVTLGDLNGDGLLDIVEGNIPEGATGQTHLYLNSGSPNYLAGSSPIAITTDSSRTFATALGDIDSDGDLDLVVGNDRNETNRIYYNSGPTTLFAGVSGSDLLPLNDYTRSMNFGDLDSDGDLDLVVSNWDNQPNRVHLNPGGLTLECPVIGPFRATGTENPNCNNVPDLWTFCQHQSGCCHTTTGGIADSDDTYAWDINLLGNADDGRLVFPIAPGKVVKYAGLHLPGAVSGAVLIEHTLNGCTWWSGYLHMSEINVIENQIVTTDTLIGKIDDVGADNSHLHLALYRGENVSGGLKSVNASFIEKYSFADPIWIDFAHSGIEDGTISQPFNSLTEGLEMLVPNGTLKIVAGSSSATPILTQPLRMEAIGGVVRIGQ